jgi:hypothetical protein
MPIANNDIGDWNGVRLDFSGLHGSRPSARLVMAGGTCECAGASLL